MSNAQTPHKFICVFWVDDRLETHFAYSGGQYGTCAREKFSIKRFVFTSCYIPTIPHYLIWINLILMVDRIATNGQTHGIFDENNHLPSRLLNRFSDAFLRLH